MYYKQGGQIETTYRIAGKYLLDIFVIIYCDTVLTNSQVNKCDVYLKFFECLGPYVEDMHKLTY